MIVKSLIFMPAGSTGFTTGITTTPAHLRLGKLRLAVKTSGANGLAQSAPRSVGKTLVLAKAGIDAQIFSNRLLSQVHSGQGFRGGDITFNSIEKCQVLANL